MHTTKFVMCIGLFWRQKHVRDRAALSFQKTSLFKKQEIQKKI